MGLAGTGGIAVYGSGLDPSAPSPLDRLVYAEYERLIVLCEMADQKQQQYPAQLKGREDGAVEDVVVLGEA